MTVVPLKKKAFVSSGFNMWVRQCIYAADVLDVGQLGPDDFRVLSAMIRECRKDGHAIEFWGIRLNYRDPKAKALREAYRRAVGAGVILPRLVFQGRPSQEVT